MAVNRKQKMMLRSCRVFLNELNQGKSKVLLTFLHQCHDVTQYFVDLFWQRQDYSDLLADLPTVHKAVKRFGTTTRLSQALAKQALLVRSFAAKDTTTQAPTAKSCCHAVLPLRHH